MRNWHHVRYFYWRMRSNNILDAPEGKETRNTIRHGNEGLWGCDFIARPRAPSLFVSTSSWNIQTTVNFVSHSIKRPHYLRRDMFQATFLLVDNVARNFGTNWKQLWSLKTLDWYWWAGEISRSAVFSVCLWDRAETSDQPSYGVVVSMGTRVLICWFLLRKKWLRKKVAMFPRSRAQQNSCLKHPGKLKHEAAASEKNSLINLNFFFKSELWWQDQK